MGADVVTYGSRKQRLKTSQAAKAKREKVALAVCGVVLLALLAFEGPKMLKRLHGTTAAPAPAPAAATPPAAGSAAATAQRPVSSVAALRRFDAKDPFAVQLGASASAAPGPAAVAPPAVRATHFTVKDPFVQQLSLSTPAPATASTSPNDGKGSTPATTQSGTSGSRNYIVILASIALADGRGVAGAAVAAARGHGVPKVKVVDSSSYPTLRTGFYAVYSGPYATLGQLHTALEQARGAGYPSAYTRRLAH